MRIISGIHKGRVLHPPKSLPVRPTTDFAKESLFNILNNYIDFDGLKVLDLFCGTGNITFEFASRGATDITSVDSNYNCCEFVKKTISAFNMQQVRVVKSDVFSFLNKNLNSYDIIFADPPYDLEPDKFNAIHELVFNKGLLKSEGWLIIEHGERIDFSKHKYFMEHRKYGNVNFSFFQKNDSIEEAEGK
jgi:16S rRNA (guanine966-N2)-methyltransferase